MSSSRAQGRRELISVVSLEATTVEITVRRKLATCSTSTVHCKYVVQYSCDSQQFTEYLKIERVDRESWTFCKMTG